MSKTKKQYKSESCVTVGDLINALSSLDSEQKLTDRLVVKEVRYNFETEYRAHIEDGYWDDEENDD